MEPDQVIIIVYIRLIPHCPYNIIVISENQKIKMNQYLSSKKTSLARGRRMMMKQ